MPMSHQKLPSRISERGEFISAQKAEDNKQSSTLVQQRRLSTNHLGQNKLMSVSSIDHGVSLRLATN